jgi:amino acid permease
LGGHSEDHFFTSTLSFTIIIHIIIYKLFLETTFWNPITLVTCLVCFLLYYVIIILGNIPWLSSFFQPQLNGQVYLLLGNPKFWILLIAMPFFALVPDITITMIQRIFYPSPTDVVMMLQQK